MNHVGDLKVLNSSDAILFSKLSAKLMEEIVSLTCYSNMNLGEKLPCFLSIASFLFFAYSSLIFL